MGTKYSSNLPSSYNVSPPSDDGSTTASNKVQWSTIKTKLTDPFNTWSASLNTALTNAFDTSSSSVTGTYTTVASDNAKTLQCSGGSFTVSLGDAATLAAGWYTNIVNAGTGVITVGVATAGNTLNGSANGTVVLPPFGRAICVVNQAANGFNIISKSTNTQGANVASAATVNLESAGDDYVHITGTTTITAITLSKGSQRTVVFDGALTLTNGASLVLPGGANITTVANDTAIFRGEAAGVVRCISYTKVTYAPSIGKQPTRQTFTSGSGTYTTPTGVTRIFVRMTGGGAGGGGGGTGAGAGGNGGNTTFGSLFMTANGGTQGGTGSGWNGGPGGSASGGDLNLAGGSGGGGMNISNTAGGMGGTTLLGPGGGGGGTGASQAGVGFGGGGGGGSVGGATPSGGGGGAGGYSEKVIVSPNATYAYSIGAAGGAGTAGTSGNAGAAGSGGIVIVDEYYS